MDAPDPAAQGRAVLALAVRDPAAQARGAQVRGARVRGARDPAARVREAWVAPEQAEQGCAGFRRRRSRPAR